MNYMCSNGKLLEDLNMAIYCKLLASINGKLLYLLKKF